MSHAQQEVAGARAIDDSETPSLIRVPLNVAATVIDGSKSLNHVPINDAATVIDGPSMTRVPINVAATVIDGS